MKPATKILIIAFCFAAMGAVAWGQTSTWTGTTSSTWLTSTNWSPSGAPSGTGAEAFFNVNTSAGTNGINMNGISAGNSSIGAIHWGSSATTARTVNNSSGTVSGVLTLNGITINSILNTIIRNVSATTHTIADGATRTLGIALGNATDNVINTDGTGGITISSIVSGANKLTKGGSGTGVLTLTGANTYSGLTTVSAGTLRLNRTGGTTIPATNNVTVSGGTLQISSNQTLNDLTVASGATLTVDAGVTLIVNGTYSVFSSTSGNAGTITVNGTLQIDQGGWPGNTGTFTYGSSAILAFANSSGSYGVGASDTWWPSTNGPANVTVSGAGGITMNVARTVSGTFQTASGVTTGNNLTLNGTCQINQGGFFTGSPTYGVSSTLIYNNSSGSYGSGDEWPSSSPFNVNVQGAGGLTLNASRSVNGTFQTSAGVTNGNNLTINGTCQINSGGFFTGSPSYAGGSAPDSPLGTSATLVYNNGAGGFNTADEWPATSGPPNITIQNATPVTLTGSRTISGILTLTSGTISLGSNNLTLSGTVSGAGAGKSVVTDGAGGVKRSIATSGSFQFPVAPTTTTFNPVTVALDAGDPTETFTVVVKSSVSPSAPDNTLCVQRTWDISEATAGGNHAALTFQWIGSEEGSNFARNLSATFHHNGSTYTQVALNGTASGGDPYIVSTTGGFPCTEFSPYVVGASGGLPIQLSSFTGTLLNNNHVKLDWTTASEVNNYGFYVQKRRFGELEWMEIPNSFIPGHGTTNIPQRYTFTDNTAATTTMQYRLKQVDLDGSTHFTEPIRIDVLTAVKEVAPAQFALLQNYPNPFNPSTEIKFSVEATEHATLDVYNALGQKVATLFDDVAESGYYYKVKFDAANLASGMYFYRLTGGKKSDLKKLLLLK